MKYSFILLFIIISITICGCIARNKSNPAGNIELTPVSMIDNKTPADTMENTPVSISGEKTPASKKNYTFTKYSIPAAKKIDPSLKAEVDEAIADMMNMKDVQKSFDGRQKLDKLCEKYNGNVPLFAYLLEHSEPQVAYKAMWGVGFGDKMKPAEKFQVLICAVKHPSDYARSNVFFNLSSQANTQQEKETLKKLAREALDDPSPHVRTNAVFVLGQVRDTESIDKIKEMLKTDPAQQVTSSAVEALDKLGAYNKEEYLDILKNGTPYVKCSVISVMSNRKEKDIITLLAGMLDDRTETFFSEKCIDETPMSYNALRGTLQEMAVIGLETITGQKFKGQDENDLEGTVRQWKEWCKKNK